MSGAPGPTSIHLIVNGATCSARVNTADRLLDVLREQAGLTGTKEACGEGECGSCTVLLDDLPVLACLVPAFQARGRRVETVEALDANLLSPLVAAGATQCGACSPGVAMTAAWLCRDPSVLTRFSLRELLAGNVCRCTGYDGIVDGVSAMLDASGEGR